MKPTIKTVAACLLLTIAASCSKDVPEPAPSPPPVAVPPPVVVTPPPAETQKDIAVIDALVVVFMDKYEIPGASLAISKDGKLVYRKGYGLADKSTKAPITVDSQFRLGSVSKTYTGVAIMKLVQEGKFKIDDLVFGEGALLGTKYGSKPYPDGFKKITVRQLLQMTSGGFVSDISPDPINTLPELNNNDYFNWMMDNTKLISAPGSEYHYINTSYFVAGRIVEKFSGKKFFDYVKEDLIKSTGETSTELAKPDKSQKYKNEVTYYGKGGTSGFEYGINVGLNFERLDAAGGLIATATDVLRFVNAIDGFSTRPDILNQSSLEQLTTPSSVQRNYALGIGVWKEMSLWYNYGSLPGTRTGFMRHDNGISVVLLLNGAEDYTKPALNDPFTYAMQDVMLDIVRNPQRGYQSIDQFK